MNKVLKYKTELESLKALDNFRVLPEKPFSIIDLSSNDYT